MNRRTTLALSAAAVALALLLAAWVRAGGTWSGSALAPARGKIEGPRLAKAEGAMRTREAFDSGGPSLQPPERPEPASAALAGRVLDADTRLPAPAGWIALCSSDTGEGVIERVACAPDGSFRIALTQLASTGTLRVGARGYAERVLPIAPPVEPCAFERDFYLQRGRIVAGRVLDFPSGEPLAGAEVRWTVSAEMRIAVADVHGVFELALPEDELTEQMRVDASAEGYCRLSTVAEIGAGSPPLLLLLPRATWIEGRVTDRAGAPIAGAEVRIKPDRDVAIETEWSHELASLAEPSRSVRGVARPPNGDEPVRTGPDGAYRSGAQVPWTRGLVITATHPTLGAGCAVLERLGAPGEVARVDLALGEAPGCAAVRGRLLLNGAPITGSIRWKDARASGWERADDAGAFVVSGLEPGAIVLKPERTRDGLALEGAELTLQLAAGEVRECELALDLPLASIAGRIACEDAVPIAGALVCGGASGIGRTSSLRSAPDGRYRLEFPLGEARYAIVVDHANERHVREEVALGSEGVDFSLPPSGRVRLRVVDAQSCEPMRAFDVDWRRSGAGEMLRARMTSYTPDPGGGFELELPSGRVDLLVHIARLGYLPRQLGGIEVPEGGEPIEVVAALEHGLALEVRIANEEGAPADHRLFLVENEREPLFCAWRDASGGQRSPSFPGGSVYDRLLTFEGGLHTAVLRGLPPAQYRFHAVPDDLAFEPATLDLRGDPPRAVELRWQPRR